MEGSICCHLAAALLYARDKWILIFCLSFELLFVVWWFLLGHIVSVVLPHILVFSFSSKLLCSSGKQLICFLNQELWGGKTPLEMLKDTPPLETCMYWSAEEMEKWYFCTEMNANVLTEHFVNITHPHSTQHPDYFVLPENHERHKLVKMKIQISTRKFKKLHSEGVARWVSRKKSPTQPN